jgi:hypothetical protein
MTRQFVVMRVMQVMRVMNVKDEEACGVRHAALRYGNVSHLATAYSLQPTA